ncbi:MAG: hypothetical protein A3F72_14215 [Bacteroidetes bacterium RIFCSPLOWO2_12_FULL_35_15]|nr:MAG: hypothetical protein A3F72_14215 [Bacteroidetes bacterium RIFCSPLOWO2_12_FULL_35_15]
MKKYFVSSLTILLATASFGQFQNIMISNTNDPEEVSICINPKNTNQIVAGANIDNVFFSNDAGLTWNINILSDTTNGVWGDPIVFCDTTGAFFFSHLADPSHDGWGSPNFLDRIVIQKSTDGGANWNAGTYPLPNNPKIQDKEGVAVNHLTNEIYITWTQFDNYGTTVPTDSTVILFSKSADGGLTWSMPKRISAQAGDCVDSDNTVEGAVPTVGPNGEIYVAWAGPNGIVFNKSLDDGNTWLPQETLVTSMPGGWDYNITGLDRCNGLPATSCDISGGPNNGTIYINWTDQRNGTGDTDVWLIKSTDEGLTWSIPMRVNNDAPGKQQFLTWMCIDQTTGSVYFIFYDRRNYSSSSLQTDVYLARTIDGGNSFTNYKINQTAFVPSSSVFFGDYIGISVTNNVIRPIWMAFSSGTLSVWTAIVNGTTLGIDESSLTSYSPLELKQNYPNPFKENTWIKFNLKKSTKVNLFVYDILGHKVATLYENEQFNEGNYDYIFNASSFSLSSGIYYYSLSCNEYEQTKKMIVH